MPLPLIPVIVTGATAASAAIADQKYKGMDRLVNMEKEDKVNELIEKRMNSQGIYAEDYKDAYGSIKGQTEYGNIKSGGTTYAEANAAAENPEAYAAAMKKAELISGAKHAMLGGALAGAFVNSTVSATQGVFTKDFCVKETGKAAANGAARGAVISGAAYGLKYLGKNNPIMSGNVASTLASSAVNLTELTYQLLAKKVTVEEYVAGIGSNAVSCFSGIVMTAAGAALFGPIGAAVAGTVAVLGMNQLYQVFTNAQEDLQLAKEARLEAEALSEVLIQQIKEEEALLVSYYQEYADTFVELKKLVDLAIVDGGATEQAIVSLAEGLNVKFKYETLAEFEDFMLSDDVLEL